LKATDLNKYLKICIAIILLTIYAGVLVANNSYWQSVVGHSTYSIPHDNWEATHYSLRYQKFNQWYVQREDYTPLSSPRSLPFYYSMTRYETRICPFDIELQYNLYALQNDAYHLLEANVTEFIEISWSGDPNITLSQMIAYILVFLITPSLLITFAIYRIGSKIRESKIIQSNTPLSEQ
jgi:hypothetical protein